MRRVGVCNVNRRQLDEALELAPIAAVQVASQRVRRPRRAGRGARAMCRGRDRRHRPFAAGRPAPRRRALDANGALAAVAGASTRARPRSRSRGCSASRLLVVAIPGARRPETARSAARGRRASARRRAARRGRSAHSALSDPARAQRSRRQRRRDRDRHGHPRRGQEPDRGRATSPAATCAAEPRRARRLAARRSPARSTTQLAAGARQHRPRQHVPHARRPQARSSRPRAGTAPPARCVWLDTPLAQAQVNLVERLLDRFGALPTPDDAARAGTARARAAAPTSQMRALARARAAGG